MKKVAVVICNYNKQDYVLKCIESLKKSTYLNYDIYVVDNASSDDSVELISDKFGEEVKLIVNKVNKGGSGGFNTGINHVIDKGYKYIYLLDNDVVLDERCLEYLVQDLEQDNSIGIVGSKILFMDNPDVIQEFGSFIDFENFNMKLLNRGESEKLYTQNIIECDYVPACSALIRTEAIKKVGIFNERYFVYWDDIDFGYRLKNNGYKVIADSKSKAYHKGGGTVRKNTFGTYYFWRNRIEFFLKYCNKENLESLAEHLFNEIIGAVYSCNYSGKYSSAKTILMALDDALNGISGAAGEGRIYECENIESKFEKLIENSNSVVIYYDNNTKQLSDLINKILAIKKDAVISIIGIADNTDVFTKNNQIKIKNTIDKKEQYDMKIKLCSHILKIDELDDNSTYIDQYYNIVHDSEDKKYIKNYEIYYNLNKKVIYPMILNKIKDRRG